MKDELDLAILNFRMTFMLVIYIKAPKAICILIAGFKITVRHDCRLEIQVAVGILSAGVM